MNMLFLSGVEFLSGWYEVPLNLIHSCCLSHSAWLRGGRLTAAESVHGTVSQNKSTGSTLFREIALSKGVVSGWGKRVLREQFSITGLYALGSGATSIVHAVELE